MAIRKGLIKDADAFLAPVEHPLFRDAQLSALAACLLGPVASASPLHAWVYGPSGSGKTTCLRHLLDTTVREAQILPVYTDCKARFTFLDMVEQILEQHDVMPEPQRTRAGCVQLLRSCLAGRKGVVVLDGLDALRMRDAVDLLHHLSRVPRVSLVCATTTRKLLQHLPASLRSCLAPRLIEFPAFSDEEVTGILQTTAQEVLTSPPQPDVLAQLSSVAQGDARRALAMLRHAIQRADEAASTQLSAAHLCLDNYDYFNPRVEEVLQELSTHHRLLYDLVASHGSVDAATLRSQYLDSCARQQMTPVAARTLNTYLNVLVLKRALHREHGPATSGWRYQARPPGLLR